MSRRTGRRSQGGRAIFEGGRKELFLN